MPKADQTAYPVDRFRLMEVRKVFLMASALGRVAMVVWQARGAEPAGQEMAELRALDVGGAMASLEPAAVLVGHDDPDR